MGCVKDYDILREVGSICAGNATVALSELLKGPIELEVPSLDTVCLEEADKVMGGSGVITVCVHTRILAGLKGDVLMLFTEESAFHLIDIFMGAGERRRSGVLTEIGMSLLKETGNIVISSYLGVLSMMLKTPVVPSIPTLSSGPIEEVMQFAFRDINKEDSIILIEVIFHNRLHDVSGSFYLALTCISADNIVRALKNAMPEER